VVSDEASQPFGSKRPEVTGAIELMQASPLKVGRVADAAGRDPGNDVVADAILTLATQPDDHDLSLSRGAPSNSRALPPDASSPFRRANPAGDM
jgi:hypothetical protein